MDITPILLILLLGEPSMAQPPAFDPSYDFNNEVTYDGAKIQTVFMEAKGSIDGIRTNLAIIQRDDGKLANSSVHFDAIDSDALLQINGSSPDVTAVSNNIASVIAVAANQANINAVVANQSNIDAVAANQSNIDTVATNQVNIAAVVSNMANINNVAGNAGNINAVVANQANIDAILANLPDIANAAAYFQSIPQAVTLNLDVTEVVGDTYTSVSDAVAYARSVMPLGGKIVLFIADNTTASWGNGSLSLTGFELSINGLSATTSIINSGNASVISNGDVELSGLKITGADVTFQNIESVTMQNVNAECAQKCIFAENVQHMEMQNVNLSGTRTLLELRNTGLDWGTGTLTLLAGYPSNTVVFVADRISEVILNAILVTVAAGDQATVTGFRANQASTVVNKGATFNTAALIEYDPPADTYGNYHSRIITAQ